MELTVASDDNGLLRLNAAGRITDRELAASAGDFDSLLGTTGYARKVLLGLQYVDYIDSSGISWLLVRHKRFREAQGKLVLHSVPPIVQQVLDVLRLSLVLQLAEDEPAAVALAKGDDV